MSKYELLEQQHKWIYQATILIWFELGVPVWLLKELAHVAYTKTHDEIYQIIR